MISSRAWRQGAGTVPPQAESDASRPERRCGTLGRNKRPYEKQDKTGSAKTVKYLFDLALNYAKIIKLSALNIKGLMS